MLIEQRVNENRKRSKMVSQAVGRCAATSIDHLRCAAVLKINTKRYQDRGLREWVNFFSTCNN